MKKNTLAIILVLTVVLATAQTKTKFYPSNTAKKPVTVQSAEKNIPVPKLPDLRISALDVTATPSVLDGVVTYNLHIFFTLQNAGYATVLTDYVSLNGYASEESWITHGKKELTGYYRTAGGRCLTTDGAGKGETLESGASITISFDSYNNQLHMEPKPICIMTSETYADVKESNTGNNLEYVPIFL